MKVITNFWVINYSFLSSSSPTLHRRHSRVIIHHVTPLTEERVKPSVVGKQFFLTITWGRSMELIKRLCCSSTYQGAISRPDDSGTRPAGGTEAGSGTWCPARRRGTSPPHTSADPGGGGSSLSAGRLARENTSGGNRTGSAGPSTTRVEPRKGKIEKVGLDDDQEYKIVITPVSTSCLRCGVFIL